jgi:glycosyltransferase involved in cell wall biosynthesis
MKETEAFAKVALMKVLLSAYACGPNQGSEPEAGLQAALTAAKEHEVWVLTQRPMVDALKRFLPGREEAANIRLEAVDPPAPSSDFGLRQLAIVHWRHDEWQRRAAVRAVELDRHIGFDIVHHVTLAAYWLRVGVLAVNKPLVWGPVGGGVEVPWALLPELGSRGLAENAVRSVVRRAAGAYFARKVLKSAAVVFVQNAETARRINRDAPSTVLSNALSCEVRPSLATRRSSDITFAGRLVSWKAARLAVRAMQYVSHSNAVLHIYGDGPERDNLRLASKRWRVADRVVLEGRVPRPVLIDQIATSGVLVHPSLHEEGGGVVAEALSLGTPLVCLDHGGPAQLVRVWPETPSVTVKPGWPDATARGIAAAIDRFLADPPPVREAPARPTVSFQAALHVAYEIAAASRSPQRWE